MCGHVGIAGKLEFKDEATLKRLLCYDYFRGPDSTGVAVIDKEGKEADILKIASHPFDLFDMTRFKTLVDGHKSSVFIGHNRAATKGKVNGVNAHPFECGHIIGAHNGTLTTSSFIKLKEVLEEDFDVDSEAIFKAIEKLGINKTVAMLEGAWALVWYDLSEGTLNFLRNKERPMWLAHSEDCNKLFWASEYPMIQAACALSAQGQPLYTDKAYKFFGTEVDLHYKYNVEAIREHNGIKPIKPKVQILKGKEPVPVATTSGGGYKSPFTQGRNGGTKSLTTTSHGMNRDTYSDPKESNVMTMFGDRHSLFGGYFTKDEEEMLGLNGCSWCGGEFDPSADNITIFDDDYTQVICHECTDSGKAKATRIYTTRPLYSTN